MTTPAGHGYRAASPWTAYQDARMAELVGHVTLPHADDGESQPKEDAMSRWSNLIPLNDADAIDAVARGWNPPGDDDQEGARVDRAINQARTFGKLAATLAAEPEYGPLPAATDAAVAGHESTVSKVAGPWPGPRPAGAAAVRGQLLLSATVLAQRVRDLTRLAGEVGTGPGVAKEVAGIRAGLLEQAAVLGAIGVAAAAGKGGGR